MKRIVKVRPMPDYRLEIAFNDGTEGIVDVSYLVGKGIFEAWQEKSFFEKVVIADDGSLFWSNGIDLCPDALYLKITGQKPEDIFSGLEENITNA